VNGSRWRIIGVAALALAAVAAVTATFLVMPDDADGDASSVAAAAASPSTPTAEPAIRRPVRIDVVGDTTVAGTAAGGAGDANWTRVMAAQLLADGLRTTTGAVLSQGAGFVSRGTDKLTFGDLAATQVRADDDVVIIVSTIADSLQEPGTLTQATRTAIASARESSPEAAIFVVGQTTPANFSDEVVERTDDAVAEGSSSVTFVRPIADGWLDARSTSAASFALTDRGHRRLGTRMAAAVEDAVRDRSSTPTVAASDPGPSDLATGPDRESLLTVSSDGAAARAVAGRCADAVTPYLEYSADGPAGLFPVPLPVSEVLGLSATGSEVAVIGPDASCGEPRRWTSTNRGLTWEPSSADDVWYRTTDRATLHAPGDVVGTSCERVLDVWQLDRDIVRITCDDGRVVGSLDGGDTWRKLGALAGLRAIDFSSPSQAMALAAGADCAAQVYTTRNGGHSWTPRACLAGDRADAVSSGSDAWYAQSSGVVYRSVDGGDTWAPAVQ